MLVALNLGCGQNMFAELDYFEAFYRSGALEQWLRIRKKDRDQAILIAIKPKTRILHATTRQSNLQKLRGSVLTKLFANQDGQDAAVGTKPSS